MNNYGDVTGLLQTLESLLDRIQHDVRMSKEQSKKKSEGKRGNGGVGEGNTSDISVSASCRNESEE